jgi:integrase
MKAEKRHRVPLTPQMVALLGERRADDVPLFEISNANAMLNTLRDNAGNGYTVHGFRSSFEDWGADSPRSRQALHCHDKRTETDRAFQRSDLLQKRREIMERWLDFVTRARS